ncbi:MAG: sugar ABC transporter substrate-binding protein, partial [Rhodobacteraceae bacterium]|nr:sugar ABC transporter substrate-binding protein [Paracoccaceae bacterium]
NKTMHRLLTTAATVVIGFSAATAALADGPVCTKDVHILAQPRDGLATTEKFADEFRTLSGAGFTIDYLNENDRRAKSRADASTVGSYNVYYVDEANFAQFASSDWIIPLTDYYPAEYDFDDFDAGRRTTATFDGKVWFAPIQGGGDLMVYRKDLLEKAGIEPPKTLEEMIAAVEKLNDPDNGVYGIALRGGRGSGANVWRWMPYFRGMGGKLFNDDGTPAFNSEAAVKATETYLKLFQYLPPGTKTGSWDESTGAFNSGQVALIVESAPLGAISLDPAVSTVADKVGFGIPPSPLTGGGYAHGFAIGAKANATEEDRKCAGLWIAWATSKENEMRRLEAGQAGELNRTSIFNSPEFAKKFGDELPKALAATSAVTAVNFWQNAKWPELGDRWGIILEELITGQRSDIKAALDELEAYAKELTAG